MNDRLTPQSALAKLAQSHGEEFITVFRHGTLEVEIYQPDKVDRQQAHTHDEIYVVISGTGYFVKGLERCPFPPVFSTGSTTSPTTLLRGCSFTDRRVERKNHDQTFVDAT